MISSVGAPTHELKMKYINAELDCISMADQGQLHGTFTLPALFGEKKESSFKLKLCQPVLYKYAVPFSGMDEILKR